MTNTRVRPARYYAAGIDDAAEQEAGYRKLAALASELGMQGEVERLTRNAEEMANEGELLIEAACDAGYLPEDLWGQ